MNRGSASLGAKKIRAAARRIMWLLVVGIVLIIAGPLYALWGVHYSGELMLHQRASAAEVVSGFDFGPVFLKQGVKGRYFVEALVPPGGQDYWLTRFEVLDSCLTPVFRQDEMRFIGDFQFAPGEVDRYAQVFELSKATGYYYFRFTALNGEYALSPDAPPVVEFKVRQQVLSGWQLWGPLIGAVLLGVIFLAIAVGLIKRLGQQHTKRRPGKRPLAPMPLERRHNRLHHGN